MADGMRQAEEGSRLRWRGDEEFDLDGVTYACRTLEHVFNSTPERFCIRKARPEIERLEELIGRTRPRTIFEVGIDTGGSTALIAQLADPRKLVAVDIGPAGKGAALAALIERRGLERTTAIHWGVDQADRARLGQIAAAEFGGEPLDFVIDDASHLLDPTRETFNVLFPRLRPGGTYLLEDWGWAHGAMNLWPPDRTPLTVLVFEAVMGSAHSPAVIERIEIDHAWALITRGPQPVELGGFDVRDLIGPDGTGLLAGIDQRNVPPRPPPSRRRGWRGLLK